MHLHTITAIQSPGSADDGEATMILIAAALGNALADATGIRFTSAPLNADRIFSQLNHQS